MGICGSSPAVKQSAKPAVGQNGHEAGTFKYQAAQQPPHAVHEPRPDVPAQEPLVTEVPPLTQVVSNQHTHSMQTVRLVLMLVAFSASPGAGRRGDCLVPSTNLTGNIACQPHRKGISCSTCTSIVPGNFKQH